MKIALITETFFPSTDGVVTRLCATIKWLQQDGHEVRIVAPDPGIEAYEGAKVIGIPARSLFLYPGRQVSLPHRSVKRILQEFEPDLVHVINPALLGVSGIYYSRLLKIPLIASYHTNIPDYADYYRVPLFKPFLWWYFRTLHNRADLNLCTSQAVLEELRERRFRNVRLWDRGVDVDNFGPDQFSRNMREKLTGGRPEQRLLLYVGRLAAEKEIEKIRDVLDKHPEFSLAIVGDGPYRDYLEQHFAGTNTVFTGFLHGKELAQAYASADAFVFPSTTETLGLVILEAMASGLPVVAAKSGPTCEQVQDGKTGLLFEPDHSDSFVNTVGKLKDDAWRRELGENAYFEGQQFGWERPSRQLFDYYRQVLDEKREKSGLYIFR
ncbi:MAG: glycosyltransferase family 1 protein [Bacillaceae bacterium]|nr:glycosyltransferase family 1 protein [Bacillaceae bacterium]